MNPVNLLAPIMLLLLSACAVQSGPPAARSADVASGEDVRADACDFERVPGQAFKFRPVEPQLRDRGYSDWQLSPDQPGAAQPYHQYAYRLAKLQPEIEEKGFKWGHFVAVLDDCSKLYARRASRTETPAELELRAEIYFTDTYTAAEQYLGHTFWLKRWPGSARSRRLITPDPAAYYPWRTFEEVRLISIDPTVYRHAPGDGPFMVEVQLNHGGLALVHWNPDYLTTENPIAPHWTEQTLTSIQNGRLTVGMPADAVLASWGEPLQVNRRPSDGIQLEQWVYRTGYAYIRDGHLQSSSTER